MNREKEYITVNNDSLEEVNNIIKEKKNVEIIDNLKELLELYDQYIFSVKDGHVLAAIKKNENKLSFSPIVIKKHFEIDNYVHITENDDEFDSDRGYKEYLHDKNGDIFLVLTDDNNIKCLGSNLN